MWDTSALSSSSVRFSHCHLRSMASSQRSEMCHLNRLWKARRPASPPPPRRERRHDAAVAGPAARPLQAPHPPPRVPVPPLRQLPPRRAALPQPGGPRRLTCSPLVPYPQCTDPPSGGVAFAVPLERMLTSILKRPRTAFEAARDPRIATLRLPPLISQFALTPHLPLYLVSLAEGLRQLHDLHRNEPGNLLSPCFCSPNCQPSFRSAASVGRGEMLNNFHFFA